MDLRPFVTATLTEAQRRALPPEDAIRGLLAAAAALSVAAGMRDADFDAFAGQVLAQARGDGWRAMMAAVVPQGALT